MTNELSEAGLKLGCSSRTGGGGGEGGREGRGGGLEVGDWRQTKNELTLFQEADRHLVSACPNTRALAYLPPGVLARASDNIFSPGSENLHSMGKNLYVCNAQTMWVFFFFFLK